MVHLGSTLAAVRVAVEARPACVARAERAGLLNKAVWYCWADWVIVLWAICCKSGIRATRCVMAARCTHIACCSTRWRARMV